ncbi:MAG TPA: hypothetical protein VMR96_07790 [Solirubrobacterales bacterium]|nr:hypothetical protein [Solirubrobacterales bacterium]
MSANKTVSVENRVARLGCLVLAVTVACTLCFGGSEAAASKQVVDYFGTPSSFGSKGGEFNAPQGVAINDSGAGAGNQGDIYVVDGDSPNPSNRIQRFGRDDNGTPSETRDDSYFFISAWGADVDATPSGGSDYEICSVAADCQSGVASGGNGTAAGNGALRRPTGIAVDQDTGFVYVNDTGNNRINVYEGDGTFLRSFGFDVVASGPGHVAAESEQQRLTVEASGGKFSLSFEGRATGPRGDGKRNLGLPTIEQVKTSEGAFAVGQGISGVGIAPGSTITAVTAETITMSKPAIGDTTQEAPLFGDTLAFDSAPAQVQAALNALPTVGGVGGSVTVSGGPGDPTGSNPYTIDFGGSLAGDDLPPLVPNEGSLTIGAGSGSATVDSVADGGAFEICVPATGDVCKPGGGGAGVGEVGFGGGIAISQPDGNSAGGEVFVADAVNRRINTYALDGSSPSAIGSAAVFDEDRPAHVAVDSRGIVYASNSKNDNEIERYDSENANGGGIGFLAPIAAPPLAVESFSDPGTRGLAIDPDSDGAGAEKDVLYVLRMNNQSGIQQFGPVNEPGLTAPPAAVDDEHGSIGEFNYFGGLNGGLAVSDETSRLYLSRTWFGGPTGYEAHGVYVLDDVGPLPTASLESIGDITATTATVHGTINPNGPPALSYHLEYSLDGASWSLAPGIPLGAQESPQAISAVLDPPPAGLEPNTLYHVRISATRPFAPPVISSEATFTTLASGPIVETTGSPIRTATTAELNARVNPRGLATTYHFEYGSGPCDSSPCASSAAQPAGSGGLVELVSQRVDDLEPNTTYHYRVVADNGAPGSPVFGADMTVTTRSDDAPLSHGHLAGPPGSDRAYEQVSLADSGGNPVLASLGFSADGNRAMYGVAGGTPQSDVGSVTNLLFAERTPAGWQTRQLSPPRSELRGQIWTQPFGTADLSSVYAVNFEAATGSAGIWRLAPGGQPGKLFEPQSPQEFKEAYGISADGSRPVALLKGGDLDPAYPAAAAVENLYDLGSGTPKLLGILPNGSPPACGVDHLWVPAQLTHWVSADGSLVFFPSRGDSCGSTSQIYVRIVAAGETRLISGPPVSGPTCAASFLSSTPEAAFFWTQSRLTSEDAVSSCDKGGDVYRYDLEDESLVCVTCVATGLDANVSNDNAAGGIPGGPQQIAVAPDGSKIYFKTATRLLSGAPLDGDWAIYRVDVDTGALAYVAPLEGTDFAGQSGSGGNAISADGSVFIFRSSDPGLNAVNGSSNAGTAQYYRYDDLARSLVCLSCPQDGSAPAGDVPGILTSVSLPDLGVTSLSNDGRTFAFGTPTALVGADQNTPGGGESPEAGQDIYEWRDGRLYLITDGLSNWVEEGQPEVSGISPTGSDVYFTAYAQYTPDAPDAYNRLYDARIGGGFEFPTPTPPCPLEVCQGTPKGAPEEALPGTGSFSGPGNARKGKAARCSKRKRKVRVAGKTRCVNRNSQAKKRAHKGNGRREAQR